MEANPVLSQKTLLRHASYGPELHLWEIEMVKEGVTVFFLDVFREWHATARFSSQVLPQTF